MAITHKAMPNLKVLPDEVRFGTIFERALAISSMFVHYRDQPGGYARPSNGRRLAKLVAEFEEKAVGILLVSMRTDGTFAVIDGQHRMLAAIEKGLTALDAYVYIDLTLAQEAHLYRKFGDYLKQNPLDRFEAAVAEGNAEALAIRAMLAECGLRASNHIGAGDVQAIGSVEKVASDHGPQVLRDVLHLLSGTFGLDHEAYSGSIVQGTAMFLVRYAGLPEYLPDRLPKRLQQIGLMALRQKALGAKALGQGIPSVAWGKTLLQAYNTGRGKYTPLPDWPERVLSEASKGRAPEHAAIRRANLLVGRRAYAEAQRANKLADRARAIRVTCPACQAPNGAACRSLRSGTDNGAFHAARYGEANRLGE